MITVSKKDPQVTAQISAKTQCRFMTETVTWVSWGNVAVGYLLKSYLGPECPEESLKNRIKMCEQGPGIVV